MFFSLRSSLVSRVQPNHLSPSSARFRGPASRTATDELSDESDELSDDSDEGSETSDGEMESGEAGQNRCKPIKSIQQTMRI